MLDFLNNIDVLKSDNQLAIEDAYKGSVSSLNPVTSFVKIPAPIPTPEVSEDRDSLKDFQDAFSLEANRTMQGALQWGANKAVFDKDYNPFKDPVLEAEGDLFMSQYGSDFLNSPNPTYTANLIQKIKETEETKKGLENAGMAGALGYLTGAISDVTTLIPVVGMARTGGILSKMAVGGVQTGAAVALGEAGGQIVDPTKTMQESAANVLMGTVLGGALFGVSGALAPAQRTVVRDILAGDISKTESTAGAQEFNKILGADNYSLEDLGPYKSNPVYAKLQELSGAILPEQRLANSPSTVVRGLGDILTQNNILKEGNLAGKAKFESIESAIEVRYFNDRVRLDRSIENAMVTARKEGLTDSVSELSKKAVHEIMDGVDTSASKAVQEIKDVITNHLKKASQYITDSHRFPEGWTPRSNYFPAHMDFGKISRNQMNFKADIADELRKLDPMKDSVELMQEVDEVADNFIKYSTGRIKDVNYKASGLQKRTLDFSSNFYKKYMSEDVLGTLSRYTKELYTDVEFTKRLGKGDPGKMAVEHVKKDYEKLRNGITNSDLTEAEKNAKLKDLFDSEAKDAEYVTTLIDDLTGARRANESRFLRNIAAIAKSYSYMRLMGGMAFSQLPDLIRGMGAKTWFAKFGDELTEVVGETVNKLRISNDKDFARKLGLMTEEWRSSFNTSSRTQMYNDLGTAPVETSVEKMMRLASNGFSKLNLADFVNNVLNKAAAENVGENIIRWSTKLANGSLKETDKGFRELARIGVDADFAKKIVDQFAKHKTVDSYWGGKVVLANFENWDPQIMLKMSSLMKREVESVIVQPTHGSKPFFMSTAVGSTLGQFKSFMFASTSKVFLPTVQKLHGMGGMAAAEAAAYISADLLAGAMSGTLRDLVTGKDVDLSEEKLALYAFERSNFMSAPAFPSQLMDKFGVGVASMLGQKNNSRLGQESVAGAFLGPSVGAVDDLTRALNRASDGDITDKDLIQLIKLMPGQNLLWSAWYFQQLKDEAKQ
jgi:hypothetical protein